MDEQKFLSEDEVRLVVRKNACIRIYGKYKLIDSDGNVSYPNERISICRCGKSSKMPFCDGTHKTNGFYG